MTTKELTKNLVVAGIAGLFTGGPIGLVASPGVLFALNSAGMTKVSKWLTWGAIGIIAAPLSLAVMSSAVTPEASKPTESTSVTATAQAPKDAVGRSNSQSQPAPAAPVEESFGVGDVVSSGDRAIKITQVQATNGLVPQNQFADPIDGRVLLVRFDVQNTGQESGNIMFSSFSLADSKGRTYDELSAFEYSIWRDEQGFKDRSDDLYPGEGRSDVAAFRVAPDATGFTLEWKGEKIRLN